mmetsp:Transcript_56695/g.90149  ORF Transcript_56695/g.90149 Transcript_56695/m.90149 type:complete len:161 (+) Transcript_56695:62-544(+)
MIARLASLACVHEFACASKNSRLKILRRAASNSAGSGKGINVVELLRTGVGVVTGAVRTVHGAVHRRFFEGEAPTLYRLRGNKYDHCYGSQKRGSGKDLSHLTPYVTGGVLASMGIFFIVFPMCFMGNYNESKRKYEKFAKEHADQLNTQFDRGQFSQRR